ncbi:MAG: hypothetical protein J6O50_16450, partial [Ruminiclostridium sp.]|nr:hypothetical protein [Ruminiclostridium sp.]
MDKTYRLLWTVSLLIISCITIGITACNLISIDLPDIATRILGIIDLLAIPVLIFASVKLREPLKTQFERKRAIHAVYCVKPPNRAPARLRRLSLYPTQLSHFLFSK